MAASYFVRALRWRVLLSAEKLVRPMTAFWAVSVGYLGNNLLPARAGELMRSVLLGRNVGIGESYVLATAVTERVLDAIVLLIVALVMLGFMPGWPEWLGAAARLVGVVGLLGLLGTIVASRTERTIRRLLLQVKLPQTVRFRLSEIVGDFLLGLRAFQHFGRAWRFAAFTLLAWSIDTFSAMQVARALGLDLSFPAALLLLSALGLASAAPSTPGYVGIYQFVAVTLLMPLGFSQGESLAYIIAFQAMIYGAVIPWGCLGLWQLTRHGLAHSREFNQGRTK